MIAKKRVPQTAEAYAKYLYCAARCDGSELPTMNDHQVVDCRVRAFIDGVNWQKRMARKAKP